MNEELRQRADALLEQMARDEAAATAPQRHAPGRASALTPTEADDIRWRYVAQGQNISQIARETGRSREAVRNIVKDQETMALQQELQQMKRARARQILAGATDTASELWVESMKVAAERGNHKPMQDLLLHEQVIDPVNDRGGDGIVVMIGGPVEISFRGSRDIRSDDVVVVRDGRLLVERVHCGRTIDVCYPEGMTLAELPATVTVTPEARQLLERS